MYSHVLVPLDGSRPAEAVLDYVMPLALRFQARLTLLQVWEPPRPAAAEWTVACAVPAPDLAMPVAELRAYLQHLSCPLRARGIVVDVACAEGRPADAIVALAAERGADLIAMTASSRGALSRLLFGSVADEVLRHAPCPVLAVQDSNVDFQDGRRARPERPLRALRPAGLSVVA